MSIYPEDEPQFVALTTDVSLKCNFCGGKMHPIKLITKSQFNKDFDIYKFKCRGCLIEISERIGKGKDTNSLNNNLGNKKYV